ncbi:S-adenosyl-L-methionine-dependent methyltransferase [Naviculisporaceae sp. PSN 640]
MASIERMRSLASEIAEKTKIVTDYLDSKGLEAASYDVDGLADFPIPPTDVEPYMARLDLVAATRELHLISVGPKKMLQEAVWSCTDMAALHAIWAFKMPQAVPLKGSISFEELTAKVVETTSIPIGVAMVRRIVRLAMTNKIFTEPTKNQVAHTRSSRLLLEDPGVEGQVGLICDGFWPAVANFVNALRKWPNSEEPNHAPFNLAYNTELSIFDFLSQPENRALSERYNASVKGYGEAAMTGLDQVVAGYPWADLGDKTIVDMGGNQGDVAMAVARAYPDLKFIVQDKAGLRTPESIGTVPAELADRVKLTAHDILEPQTVVADVYFFRIVFHCFSDKYCVKILQSLIPALRKGSRIVINDGALPEKGTVGPFEERYVRMGDIFVGINMNARERELGEWTELFARADSRYEVKRAWKPKTSALYFIEAEWTGDDEKEQSGSSGIIPRL